MAVSFLGDKRLLRLLIPWHSGEEDRKDHRKDSRIGVIDRGPDELHCRLSVHDP
jgi:hypothetical protein